MSGALAASIELAWDQLWQVTIVATVALVFVRLLCRRRPHLAYAVLLIVTLKCLTPPLVSSRLGIFSWTAAENSPAVVASAPPRFEEKPFTEPASKPEADNSAGLVEPIVTPAPTAIGALELGETPVAANAFPWTRLSHILMSIWLAGTILSGIALAIVWTRQLRFLRTACRPADQSLRELCDTLTNRLGVRRRVQLWISDADHGPLAFGVLHPTIVLPHNLASAARATIEPLIAHELIHIRRGDTIVGPLQGVCIVVWWFHPLIWLASRGLSRHRERCCDEEVLASTGCNPESYAQGLIHVLREQRRSLSAMLALGVRPLDVTKDRLELIMTARKHLHARTPRVCWIVLILGALMTIPGRGLAPSQAGAMQQAPPALGQDAAGKESKRAVQPATPATTPADPAQAERERRRQPVEFGPVLERTINDDNPQLGNFLIDFDKGTVMSPPADIRDEKAAAAWMAQQGVDAMGEGDMLLGFDMIVIPKAQSNWDPLRGNFDELNAGKPGTPVPIVPHGRSLPATYYFRTREGSSGVLQIVEVSGNATKIRYKLAKPDPAAQATRVSEPFQDPPASTVAIPVPGASRVPPSGRAAVPAGAAGSQRSPQVEEEVRKLIVKFDQAAKNNDAEAARPLFVEAAQHLQSSSVADYREMAAQGVDPGKIAAVVLGGDSALAISEFFDSSQGVPNSQRRHCVVYTCQLKDGKWLISDIDLEPVAGLVDEVNRFVRRSLAPQPPK